MLRPMIRPILIAATQAVTIAILCCAPQAVAQVDELEQIEIIPRRVAVLQPFRAYADPTRPSEETGLRALSLTAVHDAVQRMLARDPRYLLVDPRTQALAKAREPEQEDLLFIAQQSARLGREHFRAYNLASAVSELAAAVETFQRTPRGLTHPAEVADAYFMTALVELELARVDEANAAIHESRAADAMRTVIRLDPGREVTSAAYPPSVVERWRRAYVSHFVDDGVGLQLTASEASTLASGLEVDTVVYVFALTDGDRTKISLQVYDNVESRFDVTEVFTVTPVLDDVRDAIGRRLSAAIACQVPRVPTPEAGVSDANTAYLHLAFSSATHVRRPTSRVFYSRGARISLSYMLSSSLGFYVSGAQWVASSDPNGELLQPIDTTRGEISALVGGRWRRARLVGRMGLDIARVGRVSATDAFWCKVSEGEAVSFDDARLCEEADMANIAPQGQLGFALGLQSDVRMFGPFFAHASAGVSLTVVPFEGHSVAIPVWLDLGFSYRF